VSYLPTQEFKDALLEASKTARAYAWSQTGDKEKSDDLVQDALLRALENYERFEAGTNMEAWLITILKRKLLDDKKSHFNSRTELMGDDINDTVSDSGENQFSAKRLEQAVEYIDEQLGERDRSIFLMWAEGYKTAEIASALSLSRPNTGVILCRIRKQIFEKFRRNMT